MTTETLAPESGTAIADTQAQLLALARRRARYLDLRDAGDALLSQVEELLLAAAPEGRNAGDRGRTYVGPESWAPYVPLPPKLGRLIVAYAATVGMVIELPQKAQQAVEAMFEAQAALFQSHVARAYEPVEEEDDAG